MALIRRSYTRTREEKAATAREHGGRIAGELARQYDVRRAAREKATGEREVASEKRRIAASERRTLIEKGFKPTAAKAKPKAGDRTAYLAKKSRRQEQLRKFRAYQAQQEAIAQKGPARPGTFRGGAPIRIQTQRGKPGVTFTREQIRGGPGLAERSAELRRQALGARREHDITTGRRALERLSGRIAEREGIGALTGAGAPARERALQRSVEVEGMPALRRDIARMREAQTALQPPPAAPTPTPAAGPAPIPGAVPTAIPAAPPVAAPVQPQVPIVPQPTIADQMLSGLQGVVPGSPAQQQFIGGLYQSIYGQQPQAPILPGPPVQPEIRGGMMQTLASGLEPQPQLPVTGPGATIGMPLMPQQVQQILSIQDPQQMAQAVGGLTPTQVAQLTAEIEQRNAAVTRIGTDVRGQAVPQAPFVPQITQPVSSFGLAPGEKPMERPVWEPRAAEGGEFQLLPQTEQQRVDLEMARARGAEATARTRATIGATDIMGGKQLGGEAMSELIRNAGAIPATISGLATQEEAANLASQIRTMIVSGKTPEERSQIARAVIGSPGYQNLKTAIARLQRGLQNPLDILTDAGRREAGIAIQSLRAARDVATMALMAGRTPTPEALQELKNLGA